MLRRHDRRWLQGAWVRWVHVLESRMECVQMLLRLFEGSTTRALHRSFGQWRTASSGVVAEDAQVLLSRERKLHRQSSGATNVSQLLLRRQAYAGPL